MIKITNHGIKRITERNIDCIDILTCLQYGERILEQNAVKYSISIPNKGTLIVITNNSGTIIVTAYFDTKPIKDKKKTQSRAKRLNKSIIKNKIVDRENKQLLFEYKRTYRINVNND